MSRESSSNGNYNSLESFTNMRISSLDAKEYAKSASDTDDEDEEQAPVALGFVEKPQHEWSLLRHLFPCKAGGAPAWLDPVNLPSGKSYLCDICGEPLRFLLQIRNQHSIGPCLYSCAHQCRACSKTSMSSGNTTQRRGPGVFRCQLPRNNQFYSSEPPKNDGSDKPLGTAAPLCSWCGTWKGDKVCSNCKKARYCYKTHQTIHWSSAHKSQCRSLEGSSNCSEYIPKVGSNVTWPEYEIINEDESEFEVIKEDISKFNIDKSINNEDESEFDMFGKTDNEDEGDAECWASFCKRLARAPEQVLRYCGHGNSKPLWPMLSGQPSKDDIPKCTSCGSHRAFEFQILPQLLYYLEVKNDVNSLDWASIVVYTCEASCNASLAYEEEFAWVQLSSQSR